MKNQVMKTVLATLLLLTLISCSGSKDGATDIAPPEDSEKTTAKAPKKSGADSLDPANVQIQKIEKGTLTENALAHGVTKADHHLVYSSEVPGKIGYLGFELGDEVKKGNLLARIDFKTLKAQAEQAQTNLNLAEATYKRLSKLMKDGLVTQQQYDETYSQLASAKSQVAIANANLLKSSIKASHYGIISKKYVDKGEYVGPGTPLFEVVDYRNILVEAQIAETQVGLITQGSQVDVEIGALNETFAGTIETILPTADAVSKTFTARVKIPNENLRILVGMSAKLRITTKSYEDVIVAPQNAIIEEQDGKSTAYIAKNGKALKREVVLGAHQKGNVVIESGLIPGDMLIILGHRDILDGQPITIIK